MTEHAQDQELFAGLRRFVPARRKSEARCELCGADIGGEHRHLLEMKTRQVACSCDACAILFSNQGRANYKRVPRDIRLLKDFALSDAQWDALSIPISMAFFCSNADSARPVVYYPSPAGATESLLPMESWQDIMQQNPALLTMEADVECLLVNRITTPHEYYLSPIDECYKLVGIIRSRWRGFSGGAEVWKDIGAFFTSLKARSVQIGNGSCPS